MGNVDSFETVQEGVGFGCSFTDQPGTCLALVEGDSLEQAARGAGHAYHCHAAREQKVGFLGGREIVHFVFEIPFGSYGVDHGCESDEVGGFVDTPGGVGVGW